MGQHTQRNTSLKENNGKVEEKTSYSSLYRKFVGITSICSFVPLLFVGWGIYHHYSKFATSRMINSFRTQVEHHRNMIELFLEERTSNLQLIAQTHSVDYLQHSTNLANVFDVMNREYGSLNDLGVIDEHGRHLAYIGPYDLMDKIYSQTFWFKEVTQRGVYISDMFMGYRKIPHFIIAVLRSEKKRKWILRATVDTNAFRSLVENVRMGDTGEVYLVNQEGIFQTTPRFAGRIMEKAAFPVESFHEGIKVRTLEVNGESPKPTRQVVAQAWLKEPHWLLVVKQDYAEAFNDVNHANYSTLIFLHLSAFTILVVAILTARHMIKVIRNRDAKADQLNRQLMQAGKLASIGELSAGVAHEINNPLAIMLTERQILLDAIEHTPTLDANFGELLSKSLTQIDTQIQRCKRITHNLLRFARRTQSVIEPVDLNEFIVEVTELMEREAKTSGIKIFTHLAEELPPILSDPSQLQQVFLNLITNAIDAHDRKPFGSVHISTRLAENSQGVEVIVSDTGAGISPENLDKVFDPFFTTKAVDRGTGLGLSICYSTVKQLGGEIAVESEPETGTEFTLFLPFRTSQTTIEKHEDDYRQVDATSSL